MKATLVLLLSISSSLLAACLATPLEKLSDKMSILEQQSVTLTDRAKYEEELLRKLNSKCSQNDMSSCVMLKLVTYMNKLLKKASIKLTDDIEIRKTSQASEEVITFEAGRSKDDESEVLDLVANKVYAFVKSRSIKWRILPEDDVVVSASEDGNGSFNLGLSIERADNVPAQDGKVYFPQLQQQEIPTRLRYFVRPKEIYQEILLQISNPSMKHPRLRSRPTFTLLLPDPTTDPGGIVSKESDNKYFFAQVVGRRTTTWVR